MMKKHFIAALIVFIIPFSTIADVYEEQNGLLAVEAETFAKQTKKEIRQWHVTTVDHTPDITPDGDENHAKSASGKAYIEMLPDTRRTHGDQLIKGKNFSPEPGKLGVLAYKTYFNTPGKYYVWVRAYSTG
ncbi:hypothetical protein GF373_16270, partial [bacterium]|nr:hypothetical protein [bacterium]